MTDLPRPDDVVVVISPPRSASTAFARVLWNNPDIKYYAHEPWEDAYFSNGAGASTSATIRDAMDLTPVTGAKTSECVLIKEISFQVDHAFAEIQSLTTRPIVFLIRDPRLTISSRREVRRKQGRSVDFPLAETGWDSLLRQIDVCAQHDIDNIVVETSDLRRNPEHLLPEICSRLNLAFTPEHLKWQPQPDFALSNHRTSGPDHFFTRVLNSRGLEPPTETPQDVDEFPSDGGLRDHVAAALDGYRRVLQGAIGHDHVREG